jgi:hypothetical protein
LIIFQIVQGNSLTDCPEATAFIEELNSITVDPKDFYKSFNARLTFVMHVLHDLLIKYREHHNVLNNGTAVLTMQLHEFWVRTDFSIIAENESSFNRIDYE